MNRTFDRLVEFDERSRNFPIRTLLDTAKAPRSYTWSCDVWNDQGVEGACVGFAWSHELSARPKVNRVGEATARKIYLDAQKVDSWPGEDYEGTSVLAGAKTVQAMTNDLGKSLMPEYRWAFTLQDIVLTLGYKGPMVFGVNWYEGMFDTTEYGFLSVSGDLAGGHAILANGVKIVRKDPALPYTWDNVDRQASYVKLHNSWGQNWGINGGARLRLTGLSRLMEEDGDFCVPTVRNFLYV